MHCKKILAIADTLNKKLTTNATSGSVIVIWLSVSLRESHIFMIFCGNKTIIYIQSENLLD